MDSKSTSTQRHDPRPLHHLEEDTKLCTVWHNNVWNFDTLSMEILLDIRQHITSSFFPNLEVHTDTLMWRLHGNELFSSVTTYHFLANKMKESLTIWRKTLNRFEKSLHPTKSTSFFDYSTVSGFQSNSTLSNMGISINQCPIYNFSH